MFVYVFLCLSMLSVFSSLFSTFRAFRWAVCRETGFVSGLSGETSVGIPVWAEVAVMPENLPRRVNCRDFPNGVHM